jgi:hypothetical protein
MEKPIRNTPKAADNIIKIPEDEHDFPDVLFHESGFKMQKFKGKLIYEPEYDLTPNQEYYGVPGEWNVVVTYNKNNNQYKTQHPEPQFNAQILSEPVD